MHCSDNLQFLPSLEIQQNDQVVPLCVQTSHRRQKDSRKGGDLNREVDHIKCQWCKNVRAEKSKSF